MDKIDKDFDFKRYMKWLTIKIIVDDVVNKNVSTIETTLSKETVAAGFDEGYDVVKESLDMIYETLKPELYKLRDRKKNLTA